MFGAEEFLRKICGGNDTTMYMVLKLGISVLVSYLFLYLVLDILPINTGTRAKAKTSIGAGILIGAICIICKVDPFEFLASIFK